MSEDCRKAIIIPAFNASATIAETLRSVRACRCIEQIDHVFVCDDASTDDTVGSTRNAWGGSPALTVLRNEQNLGQQRTVNAALERLNGACEWAFILHADDVVKENWIELYLPWMSNGDARIASICSSYDCWYDDIGRIDPGEDDFNREVEVIKGSAKAVLDTLRAGCWWHVSGCAVRVPSLIEIGGFHSKMDLGDFEWLLRCLRAGFNVVYIPRTTMLYRQHSGSISSNYFRTGRDLSERLEIYRQYFDGGYLGYQEYRQMKLRLAYQAVKRATKQIARGNVENVPQLLRVCGLAAGFQDQSPT